MHVPLQSVVRFNLRERFSHAKTFGAPTELLPQTLGRTVLYIKDQGTSNYCTAAARSAAGSYLWGREMSFEYQTAKEGEVLGAPIYFGTDPNTADKACELYGFLPNEDSPEHFFQDGWTKPADWRFYPPVLDGTATQYIVGTPFNVYPDFDSIKEALFQGKDDNAVVVANGYWFDNWEDLADYFVPMPGNMVTRHSYLFIDWTTLNGKEYLIAQLSQGTAYGNGGILLMSKETVNAAFKNPALNGFGCTIFRKGLITPIQTEINLFTRLVIKLGEWRDYLRGL